MKKGVLACLALLCGLGLAIPARAAGTTEVGIGAIFVSGTHTEQTGERATANLVPAPLLTFDHWQGRWGLHVESIPPLGPVPIGSNGLGLTSTQLSYLSASVRFALAPTTRIGVGEMIYNQQSLYNYPYSPPPEPFATLSERRDTDRSRIVGAQFEVIQLLHRTAKSSVTAYISDAPNLRGALGEKSDFIYSDGSVETRAWYAVPEVGSQFSAIFENAVRENKRLTLHYGVRTVNMMMRFSNGALADRNAFVVPFIGVSTTLGR